MRELRQLLPPHLFEFLEHNQLQSLFALTHSNLGDLDRRSRLKPLSATVLNQLRELFCFKQLFCNLRDQPARSRTFRSILRVSKVQSPSLPSILSKSKVLCCSSESVLGRNSTSHLYHFQRYLNYFKLFYFPNIFTYFSVCSKLIEAIHLMQKWPIFSIFYSY